MVTGMKGHSTSQLKGIGYKSILAENETAWSLTPLLDTEDNGNTIIPNADNNLPTDTALHSTRLQFFLLFKSSGPAMGAIQPEVLASGVQGL
jgi:hypothetical protein